MPPTVTSPTDLTRQLSALTKTGKRTLVAVVGAPASGKSTFAEQICDHLNAGGDKVPACAILPMDGFHFDDAILGPRGHLPRKGAPHTFDVRGLIAVHDRLKRNEEPSIAVPVFDREQELSRASARLIDQQTSLVLVEGNYLMLPEEGWDQLQSFYDLTVLLDVPEQILRDRLLQRWRAQGLSETDALAKADHNDLPNARLVTNRSKPTDLMIRQA